MYLFRKSSKQKKRDERKRAKGKKGTVFEEEYLINSLKKVYERTNQLKCKSYQGTDNVALTLLCVCVCAADYGNLLRAMVPFGYVEEARTSQVKFEGFLKHLQDKIDEIFVPLQLLNGQVSMIKNER